MTVLNNNFIVYAGDTYKVNVTVKDGDDVAVDLTDSSIFYQAAKTKNGTPVISLSVGSGITITDAVNGVFRISFSQSDTSALDPVVYFHEAKVVDSAGNRSIVFVGKCEIRESIIK